MGKIKVNIRVNGKERKDEVEPRMLLAHYLRDVVGATGTHIGCDTSNCGACTVIMDGKAVKSCTVFVGQANGREVKTVESLSQNGKMNKIQKAFLDKHGLQCGYCTSGMLMTSYWLLKKKKKPTEEEIRRNLGGNLCRCTGYQNIVEAVKYASELIEEEPQEEEVVAH